jgi:hypothetical protein
MDDLIIEDLRQLVTFYNNRANQAELKNNVLQLIVNRLNSDKQNAESLVRDLRGKIANLNIEIEQFHKNPEPVVAKKPVGKNPKAKA